jgi:hypothetical protein
MRAVHLNASSPAPARVRLGVAIALLLVACAIAAGVADAAQKKPKSSGPSLSDEHIYRCKSATGHSFFGQNIPPECMGADVEVLDQTGRVVRMIPGAKSLEQITAQKAADDAKAAAAERMDFRHYPGPHRFDVPMQEDAFEWFDRWLAGSADPHPREKRARYFMMGANEWREAETGRKRKYYRLRTEGRKELEHERERWMTVHETLTNLWKAQPSLT